jgi:hypothetical protein
MNRKLGASWRRRLNVFFKSQARRWFCSINSTSRSVGPIYKTKSGYTHQITLWIDSDIILKDRRASVFYCFSHVFSGLFPTVYEFWYTQQVASDVRWCLRRNLRLPSDGVTADRVTTDRVSFLFVNACFLSVCSRLSAISIFALSAMADEFTLWDNTE